MNFINSCVKWEGGEFHWVNGGVQYGARHVITSSEGGGGRGREFWEKFSGSQKMGQLICMQQFLEMERRLECFILNELNRGIYRLGPNGLLGEIICWCGLITS